MMPTQPSGYGPSPVVMHQPTMGQPPAYPGPPDQAMAMPIPMQQLNNPVPVHGIPTAPPPGVPDGWPLRNMICPPGLEYLIPLDKIFMNQKVERLEIATSFECRNRYTIVNEGGESLYMVREDSSWMGRAFLGTSRSFTIRVTDKNGREAIRMQKPMQFIGDEVQIFNGTDLLGLVVRQACTCVPEFSIYNPSGRTVLRISGPFCMCGFDHEFTIYSATQDCAIGQIKKQWSGAFREILTNADNFGVVFPMDLDVKIKALLLGAVILIDFAYFERNN